MSSKKSDEILVKVVCFVKLSTDEDTDRSATEQFDVEFTGINGYIIESAQIASVEQMEKGEDNRKSSSPSFPSLNPSPSKYAMN